VDELQEYAEQVREARSDAPVRRAGGCGCIGWGLGAIVLLLLAEGVVHVWFPLLFVLIVLIVAGMALTLLISGARSRGAPRGPIDAHNADWHPLAVVRNARRESIAQAALRRTPPPAASPVLPPDSPPVDPATADPALAAAAAGVEIGDLPAPPEPGPDDAEPAAAGLPYVPEAPPAPDAPEAPDWA
jgi:hypothetical protein